MAKRKGVITFRVMVLVILVAVVGLLMGARIFLSTQITGLRAQVADLENQKEFLEAGSADLHKRWIQAAADEVIVSRARKELGLIVPADPGPTLVCLDQQHPDRSGWRTRWHGLWNDDLTRAQNGAGEMMAGAMVSLVPRGALADAPHPGGD